VQNGKSFRRAWMPLTGTVASDSSRGKVSQTMWTFRIKKTKGEEKIGNFGNLNEINIPVYSAVTQRLDEFGDAKC
jgi:hypothetical protein